MCQSAATLLKFDFLEWGGVSEGARVGVWGGGLGVRRWRGVVSRNQRFVTPGSD